MADTWVTEWGYGYDIIREAYEVCVNTTSQFSIPYIKKIISEWHKSGVKIVDDIAKLNTKKTQPAKKETAGDYSDFISGIISQNEGDN